eukprot:scaffold2228_cov92-Cylindrotheca_fusiformis.AAC.1
MASDRASKRIRQIKDIPPTAILNGIVSASSQTPTIDERRVADIQNVRVGKMDLFFDKEGENPIEIPEYNIAGFVKKALKSLKATEEDLRNAIYSDLHDNQDIPFPESSQSSDTGLGNVFCQPGNQKSKEYKESNLSSLLVEWSKENCRQDVNMMPRIMRGLLPLTTASKPDLAPLDKRGSDQDVQILMGEFKNDKTYNVSKAKTQCIMYLLGLLYFLRVELGKPVETVYGFFVCGIQCRDQDKTYTVGLISLSAPQKLGEEIKAKYFLQKGSVDNTYPLCVLIHFLKVGRRWSTSNQPCMDESRRIPSLLILPTCLWTDSDDRELVLHGTLSIVFRISGKSLQALLSDESPHFKNLRNGRDWERFCDEVTSLLTIDGDDTRYFLKIRSKDLSLQERPMGEMCNVWDILMGKQSSETPGQQVVFDSLSKTYPVKPCLSNRFGIILMRDRGRQLKEVPTFPNGKSIIGEFQKVIQVATFLDSCLPHGDILPHNMVYNDDTGELTLIDVDEGVRKLQDQDALDCLPKRNNVYNEDETDWYIALSYPNAIRTISQSYTQCQLIASFLYVVRNINDLSINNLLKDSERLQRLQSLAKDIGDELCKLDDPETSPIDEDMEHMAPRVAEVYNVMTKIVNEI